MEREMRICEMAAAQIRLPPRLGCRGRELSVDIQLVGIPTPRHPTRIWMVGSSACVGDSAAAARWGVRGVLGTVWSGQMRKPTHAQHSLFGWTYTLQRLA